MKTTLFGFGLAAVAASVNAVDYEVASCAELADIDDTTVTSLTITSSDFACDSYTRFRVRNDMVLKADSEVVFSNFALKVLGTLTVEPNVTFQDVVEQETNGGALYVDKGASATFEGRARFTDNSVMSFYADEYKMRNGGAVFNKGDLVFDGNAVFSRNFAHTPDSTDTARGGAIYNARIGTITFNGRLTANQNRANGFFEGNGGVIFNAGQIVAEGASSFTENESAEGGAIENHRAGTMTFNGFATFTENTCFSSRGGAIVNYGSLDLLGGSLFLTNFADSAGDGGTGGGIHNGEGGIVTFNGDNTFDDNWGYVGSAIYNAVGGSISVAEDGQIILQNLRGEICDGIYYAADGDADPVCEV